MTSTTVTSTAAKTAAPINDKREIAGWTMYDWANSAFSTTVATVFLGPYVTGLANSVAVTNPDTGSKLVYLLGELDGAVHVFDYDPGKGQLKEKQSVNALPPGVTGMVGKRILFAWNGSTESARAISLAMPVMAGAEAIEVMSVEGAMVPGPTSAEIAESLRSHGLNVTSQHVKAGAKSAGQTIIDRAQALGADLIVKGAYTQSRLRQMIFGGVTRDLILTSPLPVLFSY
mgnify:CR=1 FL=1